MSSPVHRARVPTTFRGEKQTNSKENIELWEAAREGNIDRVKIAIKNGGNPNYFRTKVEGGPTSLHEAARIPNATATCTRELIEKGAEVNVKLVSNFNSPLHEAASNGNLEICKLLVEAGATVTSGSGNGFGNTPLHTATRVGAFDLVKFFIENGSDLNSSNNRGSTPLHLCSFLSFCNGNENIEGTDTEPLVDVYIRIATLLIEKGIDVNKADFNGYTALHVASQRGCMGIVKLLLDSGADLNCKTLVDERGRGGRTPAQMAKFGEQKQLHAFLCKEENRAKIESVENYIK